MLRSKALSNQSIIATSLTLALFVLAGCFDFLRVGDGDRPRVEITQADTFYDVDGITAQTLVAQLNQRGPTDLWGLTTWNVTTKTPPPFGFCETSVEIIYLLPRHTRLDEMPSALRASWDRMITALVEHEKLHGRHAVSAAEEIQRNNCENQEEITRKWNAEDTALDARTNHGIRDGVAL